MLIASYVLNKQIHMFNRTTRNW